MTANKLDFMVYGLDRDQPPACELMIIALECPFDFSCLLRFNLTEKLFVVKFADSLFYINVYIDRLSFFSEV